MNFRTRSLIYRSISCSLSEVVPRKRHSADFKARVTLEAIKGEQTLAEIGARHGVHLTQVAAWKNAAKE